MSITGSLQQMQCFITLRDGLYKKIDTLALMTHKRSNPPLPHCTLPWMGHRVGSVGTGPQRARPTAGQSGGGAVAVVIGHPVHWRTAR